MASLRGARYALAPRWHQAAAGISANPLHAALRPQLRNNTPCLAERRLGARNFSIEAIVDGSVQFAYDVVVDRHAAGASWIESIATLALLASGARLPLQLYAQHIMVRQATVSHLVRAWRHLVSGNKLQKALRVAQERKRILKEYRAQDWKTWAPILGVPVWLVNSEAIRRLCGIQGGLISLVTGRYRDTAKSTSEGATSISDQTATALATTTDGISNGAQSAAAGLDLGVYDMAGQLLFDLAAPDPWLIGPAALAITMVYTYIPRGDAMKRMVWDIPGTNMNELNPGTKWRVRFSRAMLVASVVVPFAFCQLPSGLFIYWICSLWWTRIIEFALKSLGKRDPEDMVRSATIRHPRVEEWLLRRTY